MSKNYKLSLNLPQELNDAQQRVLEGTEIVVTRGEGYNGPLTDAELKIAKADPYIVIAGDKGGEDAEGGENTPPAPKPPTKKELLAAAEAEGLKLEVTEKNTVAEITAAIEEARNAGDGVEDEDTGDEGSDEGSDEDQGDQGEEDATGGEDAEGGENTDK